MSSMAREPSGCGDAGGLSGAQPPCTTQASAGFWPSVSCALTHVGRKSGREYRTVLEVVGTNPPAGEFMVIAGFGPSSDWYRNIAANPACEVVVGRHRFVPQHRVLGEAEAVDGDRGLRTAQPLDLADRSFPTRAGCSGGATTAASEARERLVHQLPVVAFRPRTEPGDRTGQE